jgi:hypothetical protein
VPVDGLVVEREEIGAGEVRSEVRGGRAACLGEPRDQPVADPRIGMGKRRYPGLVDQ